MAAARRRRLITVLCSLLVFAGLLQPPQPAAAVPPDGFLLTNTALWGNHGTTVLRTAARDGEPSAYFATAGATVLAAGFVAPQGINDITVSYWWEVRCYDADSRLVRVPTAKTAATLRGDPQLAVDPTYLAPPTLVPSATLTIPTTCAGKRANDTSIIFYVSYGTRQGARNDFLTLVAPSDLPGPDLPDPASVAIVTLWRVVQPVELTDIRANGYTYRLGPGNIGKYFYPTREQAEAIARMYTEAGIGGPYTVTSASIVEGRLAEAEAVTIAGEGRAFFVSERLVALIGRVRIW